MADRLTRAEQSAAESGHGDAPARGDPPATPTDLPRVALKRADRRVTLLLLLVCAGIYLPVMGSYGMFDPWETHYTEVARQFMERDDWLSTYWHNGTGPEGYAETNFWSKPVGSFWMSGLALKVFGLEDDITLRGAAASGRTHDPGEYLTTDSVEWAVRLPFFLTALFGIFCVYLMCSRLFSPRAGTLAAVITATAPMYFMIGRQAMTDMPYVGPMSGGLALFALAVFGEREEMARRSVRLGRWTISWPHATTYYLFVFAFALLMTLQLTAIIDGLLRIPLKIIPGVPLSAGIVMVIYIVASAVFLIWSTRTRTRNEVYLYTFYMATAIAGLAKGLIGALQPGFFILLYVLASREWRMLADAAIGRGLVVSGCVFAPWYHGMVTRYGRSFWNELFGTEQFRRLTIGEQKQAKGTWEYYLKQLGYGMFPWIAFLPASMARAFTLGGVRERTGRDRARLFCFVWLAGALALFTLTVTKYHHYILPAIAPAAIIIAIYLDDLYNDASQPRPVEQRMPTTTRTIGLIAAAAVLLVVSIDLVKQPAHWVWMFTYLYTSNWARGVPEGTSILIYALCFAGAVGLLLMPQWGRFARPARKIRQAAIGLTAAVAIGVGGYVLNDYQLRVAPHWSQKHVLKTYYRLRRDPSEELIAWQFNWRGETWYTAAQVVVSKSLNNDAIRKWLSERTGRRFFFITERSRYGSLRQMLPTERGRKTLRIVDDSNVHYVLAEAYL